MNSINPVSRPQILSAPPSSTLISLPSYFLKEERVAMPRERSEGSALVQERLIRPEEDILRVVQGWKSNKGYLCRLCLKKREKVSAPSHLLAKQSQSWYSSALTKLICLFCFSALMMTVW